MEHFLKTSDIIFTLASFILPLLLGWLHARVRKRNSAEMILHYYLIIAIGIQGFISGLTESFFPELVVAVTHWSYCNFLRELGFANMSYALIAFIGLWIDRSWRLATIVGYSLFLLMTGVNHLVDIARFGINPGDSGGFVYIDLLVPLTMLPLAYLTHKKRS
jgi:hypothetical protein